MLFYKFLIVIIASAATLSGVLLFSFYGQPKENSGAVILDAVISPLAQTEETMITDSSPSPSISIAPPAVKKSTPSPSPSFSPTPKATEKLAPSFQPKISFSPALSPTSLPLPLTVTPSSSPTPIPTPTLTPALLPTSTLTPTPTPIPVSASPSVVINEIAWMGTDASTTDEWIELYNYSSLPADLTGWILTAQDGTPKISLASKVMEPLGFYLLERTNDNTISDIPADQFYTGALGNSGEILELRDSNGNLIDLVSCTTDGSWCAGDNTTKSSMERISPQETGGQPANWQTNKGIKINGHDGQGNPINGTPKTTNGV